MTKPEYMKPLHIGCAADENMIFGALAACHSVERHTSKPVHFHLIMPNLSPSSQTVFDVAIDSFRNPFNIYKSTFDFSSLIHDSTYPPSTFLRLELLDRIDCDRCLFLDADTMVRADLQKLSDTCLRDMPIAAAVDQAFFWQDFLPYDNKRLRPLQYLEIALRKRTSTYFNAGVMLVDIREWKRRRISTQVIEFCAARPSLVLLDQDGINSVVDDRFIRLPPKYNAFSYMEYALSPLQRLRRLYALVRWSNPAIVHFSYKSKPWEPDHFPTRFDEEFWSGLQDTPMYPVLVSHFERKRVALYGEQVRRSLVESARGKARRSRILRGLRLPPRYAVSSSLSIRWIGELLCTLSRLASRGRLDRDPWRFLHDYGAAIIQNAADR